MSIPCPSGDAALDPSAWGARNRVTLYPGKVQTWVLARGTDRDTPTDVELRNMARAVIGRWFSETPTLDLPSSSGGADEITVGQVSKTPPKLTLTLQLAAKLPGPPPLLKAGTTLYVPVSFVWRSQSETSRPWPTWRVNWGFGGPCPVDADWLLYAVGSESSELRPAEPERSMAERVGDVGTALQWIGAGLLVFGAAYTINALRPR